MQINAKKIRPYLKIAISLAVLAAGVYAFYILDYYFYPALTGSQEIFTLQKSMSGTTVDINKFNSLVNGLVRNASSSSDITPINPFK
jgi:hypothetical protein